jgi:putative Holliday junction resolvase
VGRILALDYGKRRVGIAVTDSLKITANGLNTVETSDIKKFITEYLGKESIDCLVVGYPTKMNYQISEAEKYIIPFISWFSQTYPAIRIERIDERFTSRIAGKAMINGGIKKKARRDKALVDKISAVIILQSYLEILKYEKPV